jgi:PadR family transcriptional regulator, regulatory protein PadR
VSTSMIRRNDYKNRIELLQGTLDMLILQTLRRGPQHGYGIVQTLFINSSEGLQVETGSLYPALHRLEARSGFDRSGSAPRAANARSITALPPPARPTSRRTATAGSRLVEVIASIMGPQPKEGAS